MNILITGANGQLGLALREGLKDHETVGVDLPDHDIADKKVVDEIVGDMQPDLLLNCAAYTNVDGCAKDPEAAYRANALGPQNLALACLKHGTSMVHVSTNEVFAGSNPAGYEEWMPLSPINPYGRSKAAGEFNVRSILPKHYIVRTAWLYASTGRNFIHAILNRAAETGKVSVVTDEIGNPTWAKDLAQAIGQLIETERYGTYHFVNAGSCSRWEFANEILRLAGIEAENEPILSSEFKRPSTPPPFGALHNINGAQAGITLRPWQAALAEFISEIK